MPQRQGKPTYHRTGGAGYKGGVYAFAPAVDKDHLTISIDAVLYDQILALSYLRGEEGRMSPVIREFMRKAVRDYIEQLDPADRKLLEERILPNVSTSRNIFRKKRREKAEKINRDYRLALANASDRVEETPEEEDDFEEDPAP